jgi:hypothetical protein
MRTENEETPEHHAVFASKKQAITVIIVLFVLFCVGFIAFRSAQHIQMSSVVDNDALLSPTLIPSPDQSTSGIPEPKTTSYVQITKDWPLYTHPDQAFRIKYPTDWVYQNTCAAFKQFRNSSCLYSPNFRFNTGDSSKARISQQPERGELVVIRAFDDTQYVSYDKETFCAPDGSVVVSNCREDVLRGEKVAIRELGEQRTEENIWVIRDSTVIAQISIFSASGLEESFSSVMLSTLDFTNGAQNTSSTANTKGSCARSGCSGELCVDSLIQEEQGGLSTACVFKQSYACLQNAICERQADGTCGFTQTPESEQCFAELSPTSFPQGN